MAHYASLTMIKEKLRLQDSSIDDELLIYIDEIDSMINRQLRAKFGIETEYGYEIPLPLTEDTNPPLTFDLRQIAADLVEGKFRLKTTGDEKLLQTAREDLVMYLDESFGWTEGHTYRRYPTMTITPTNGSAGTTITATGSGFKPRGEIYIKIIDKLGHGFNSETSPAIVLTDDDGNFSSVTFSTLATDSVGSYQIVVHDKVNASKKNFTVTS